MKSDGIQKNAPDGMPLPAWSVLGIVATRVVLWMSDCAELGVTALPSLDLFPLLEIGSAAKLTL